MAKALELGRLSDHGELGPALHKMPVAHVRNGPDRFIGPSATLFPIYPEQPTLLAFVGTFQKGEFRTSRGRPIES
jgi:hypothetical protein